MRISRKETTWIQDPASPNHQEHPVQDASSKQQTNKQKYKHIHHQTGVQPHSALQSEGKQTNKNHSTNLTLYEAYTTTAPILGGQKPKGRRIQPWNLGKRDLKHNKFLKNNEKAEKTTQIKKQTRKKEVQINEKEIG